MSFSTSSNSAASTGSVSNAESRFPSAFDDELRQLIRARTGIVVQEHQRENLYNTVVTAMQRYGHSQIDSFMQSLQAAAKNSAEMEFLIAGITVGESYFFRDTGQINFLRDHYLPELISRRSKTDKHLRIWSAGCSDGQELYTLAFLLHDLIPDLENWRLHLLGTDINTETLATCLRGHYREWSFRNMSDSLRSRYFQVCEDGFELRDDVRSMARFTYLNLAEDAFPSLLTDTNGIDLILCRNVFIYFDQATVDKVLQKFKQCLVADGVLMLGASDLVNNNVPGLELVQTNNTFYYRRPAKSDLFNEQASQNVKTPPRVSSQNLTTARKEAAVISAPRVADSLQQLHEYLAHEQWQAADEAADRYLMSSMDESAEFLLVKATAAANLGNLEQASQLCQRVLVLDPVDKHAHFLSAIVFMELEQVDAAEAALRKVLFLDAKFLEAHYQLGLLQLRCGEHLKGVKSLKNALRLAEHGDPQHSLHGAPDTNFERMAEMLRKEITLHEKTLPETNVQVGTR